MSSASNPPPPERRLPRGGRSRPTSMIEPGFSVTSTPTSDSATSKAAKRRSLLPQLSRIAWSEEKESHDGTGGALDGGPAWSDQGDGAAERYGGEAAKQADRHAMPPPPSRSRRPLSMRPPASGQSGGGMTAQAYMATPPRDSDGAVAGSGTPSRHPSTASAASSLVNSTEPGLKRSSSIRPPRPVDPAAGLARTNSVQAPRSHGRSGSIVARTASTSGSKHGSTSGARLPPVNNGLASDGRAFIPAPSPTKISEHRQITKPSMPPPSKPSFNTYQQHYSPAKSSLPKPPVPATRPNKASSVGEDDAPMSFEVTKQQAELTQLSILHRTSFRTVAKYDASARRKIGKRHVRLKKELENMSETEREQHRFANLRALDAWCADPSHLAESLQTLGRVHQEVGAMAEHDSGYAGMVQAFEAWVSEGEECLAGRGSSFVQPLSESWKHAHASVALRLRSSQRDLLSLPRAQHASSLSSLLGLCESLVDGMLRELDTMAGLEREMLRRDKERIDGAVAALSPDSLESSAAAEWTPVWQRVA